MKVNTKAQAWNEADKIFPSDYTYDSRLTHESGYPVFTGQGGWINDLNTRLEVNLITGETVNIWICDDIWE